VTTDGVRIGNWIYWPLTGRNYKQVQHCYWFSHYKALHANLLSLFPLVFIIRFLATDLNTRTIWVTLQISLCYSTHQVFTGRLLVFFCTPQAYCLLARFCRLLLLLIRNYAHLYRCSMDTHHRKHVFAIQPIGALAGSKKTTSHNLYPLLCDVTADTKKTLLQYCWPRALPSNWFTCHNTLVPELCRCDCKPCHGLDSRTQAAE
jgi:hypothetical protein